MQKRKEAPEVNTGSTADIAFLLLIFFLVTTVIETEKGLDRLLPRLNEDNTIVDRKKKNVLPILIDREGQLLVREKLTDLKDLKKLAIAFLDNGGAPVGAIDYCDYCAGERRTEWSDNPLKAIVSLTSDRATKYGTYIAVQNELVAAYNELRNREAKRLFNTSYTEIQTAVSQREIPQKDKNKLKAKLNTIREMFPLNIVDVQKK